MEQQDLLALLQAPINPLKPVPQFLEALEGDLITFFGIHALPATKVELLSHSKLSRPNGLVACRARENVIFTVHSGSCFHDFRAPDW